MWKTCLVDIFVYRYWNVCFVWTTQRGMLCWRLNRTFEKSKLRQSGINFYRQAGCPYMTCLRHDVTIKLYYLKVILFKPFRQCHSRPNKRFLGRDYPDESGWFTQEYRKFDWLLYQVFAKFSHRGVCSKRRPAFSSERTKKKGKRIGIPWIQAKRIALLWIK